MKYTIRLVMLVLILTIFNTMNATYDVSQTGYGFKVGGAWGDNAAAKEKWVPRARGDIQIKLAPILLSQFGISYMRLNASPIYKTETVGADLRFLLSPNQMNQIFPFFYSGVGVVKDMSSTSTDPLLMIPIGFGFQSRVGEQLGIEVSGGYNLVLSDKMDGIVKTSNHMNRFTGGKQDGYFELMVGLQYFVRSGKKTKPQSIPASTTTTTIINNPPFKAIDTDKDGLTDEDEIKIHKTNPNISDTDGDGLLDGEEINKYKTDPTKKDTDGDGITDGDEVLNYLTDPKKVDTDGDGLSDGDEVFTHGTNPIKIDSDSGGMNDGAEIKLKKNPFDAKDDLYDLSKGKKIVLHGINFETNKASILPESEIILQKVRESMELYKDVTVTIVGHTDNVGERDYNQNLSLLRAQAVKDWLSSRKIDAKRMKIVGKGNAELVSSNDTEEGRAQNRRIEFIVD